MHREQASGAAHLQPAQLAAGQGPQLGACTKSLSQFAVAGWDGKPIPFWLYKLHGMGRQPRESQACLIVSEHTANRPLSMNRHSNTSRKGPRNNSRKILVPFRDHRFTSKWYKSFQAVFGPASKISSTSVETAWRTSPHAPAAIKKSWAMVCGNL